MKKYIFCLIICFLSFSTCPNNLQAVDSYTCIELKGHTNKVNCAAFSPDGKKVVTASSDTTARIWDTASGKELHRLEGHTKEVFTAFFAPDGKKIVTASADVTARIWDAESGNELKNFKPKLNIAARLDLWIPTTPIVRFASFSPDGKVIVAALERSIQFWDAESGNVLRTIAGHPEESAPGAEKSYRNASAVFSSDGKMIATAGFSDGNVRIWDTESGCELRTLIIRSGSPFAAFSSDGKKVVTSSSTDLLVWDVNSKRKLKTLLGWDSLTNNNVGNYGRAPSTSSVIFFPDGRHVVASVNNKIRIGTDTESKQSIFKIHKEAVIFNVESGEEVQKLEGHTAAVNFAACSSDGNVVTASDDTTAIIWFLNGKYTKQTDK